jgi:hypothetical protein
MSEPLRLTIVYEDAGDGWMVARVPPSSVQVDHGKIAASR